MDRDSPSEIFVVKVSHLCTTNFMNYIPIFLQLLKDWRNGNIVHEVCRAQMTYFDYNFVAKLRYSGA